VAVASMIVMAGKIDFPRIVASPLVASPRSARRILILSASSADGAC
jgi:hypothetical protein